MKATRVSACQKLFPTYEAFTERLYKQNMFSIRAPHIFSPPFFCCYSCFSSNTFIHGSHMKYYAWNIAADCLRQWSLLNASFGRALI